MNTSWLVNISLTSEMLSLSHHVINLSGQELPHIANDNSYTFNIYLFFSVSLASCLQPRHTCGWRSQALLAFPPNWPIRCSWSDHHSLPLCCPFPALQHHTLHLPVKVRHTGRWKPDPPAILCVTVNIWLLSHWNQSGATSELEKNISQ